MYVPSTTLSHFIRSFIHSFIHQVIAELLHPVPQEEKKKKKRPRHAYGKMAPAPLYPLALSSHHGYRTGDDLFERLCVEIEASLCSFVMIFLSVRGVGEDEF